jgi:raffinose/stachyose/melibiose transport system substrate-binding protein
MTRRTQRAGALTAGACAAALLAAACGGSGGGATGSASPKQFTYLTNAENTTIKTELATLAKTSCAAANKALPLTVDTVPQTNLDQKLQLLAGQKALPVQFAAGSTPQLTATLDKAGDLVNFQQALSRLGSWVTSSPPPYPPSSPCTAGSSTSCPMSSTSRASSTTRSSLPTTA